MNNRNIFLLPVLLLLYAAGNLPALGRAESDPAQNGQRKVEASGKVRMVGSSPMTSLVISGESREWFVEPGEEQKLAHLQQQEVTVKATEYYLDMVFGNGSSAGRYYYLKNITVVSPKR